MIKNAANNKRMADRLKAFDVFGNPFTTKEGYMTYVSIFMDLVRDVEFKHPKLGMVNDIDWIIKDCVENCERYPTLKYARESYERYLVPSDMLDSVGLPADHKPCR